MSADTNVISVVVRSASPAGKGELIGVMERLLKDQYPGLTINVHALGEDTVAFNPTGTLELCEGIDTPGFGGLLHVPGMSQSEMDQLRKHRTEISQLLQLFIHQMQDPDAFKVAKVEYPLGEALLTLSGDATADGESPAFTVTYRDGVTAFWTTRDQNQAMDIFRHYATAKDAPLETWVWVKTMDVPRALPNYLKYETPRGTVNFLQNPSGLADGDFYYSVQFDTANADTPSKPVVAGSFSVAVDYFLKCASGL